MITISAFHETALAISTICWAAMLRSPTSRSAVKRILSLSSSALNLVPHMTVAENIWLGREPMKYGFVDHGQLTRQTQALLDKLNIRLTADVSG